jgi:hypothetical protein
VDRHTGQLALMAFTTTRLPVVTPIAESPSGVPSMRSPLANDTVRAVPRSQFPTNFQPQEERPLAAVH